jgi:hypothetical protein
MWASTQQRRTQLQARTTVGLDRASKPPTPAGNTGRGLECARVSRCRKNIEMGALSQRTPRHWRQGLRDRQHGHADVPAPALEEALGLGSGEMSASWGEAELADRQCPLKSVENDPGCVKTRGSTIFAQGKGRKLQLWRFFDAQWAIDTNQSCARTSRSIVFTRPRPEADMAEPITRSPRRRVKGKLNPPPHPHAGSSPRAA